MNAILLSVKPEYVEKILSGIKKYEFRKHLAAADVQYIYLYSTTPVMKVVAKIEVTGTLQASPTALWEKTKNDAGISRQNYRLYFKGCKTACAYKLGAIQRYEPPKVLSDFGITTPPQSFAYVHVTYG